MVIDVISYDKGWEETGDYYRCLFGLEPKYGEPEKYKAEQKIKNVNKRLEELEKKHSYYKERFNDIGQDIFDLQTGGIINED